MSEIQPFGKHIFLTGNVQVGKSTILRKIIEACPEKEIGGFFTKWINKNNIKNGGLYIFKATRQNLTEVDKLAVKKPAGELPGEQGVLYGKENMVAGFRPDNYKKKITFPEVFDTLGTSYLSNTDNADLILMDEIGVFEDKAPEFKKCVLGILDRDTQVIGVVRDKDGILTNAIKIHPNVTVIDVTVKNRNELLENFLEQLKKQA